MRLSTKAGKAQTGSFSLQGLPIPNLRGIHPAFGVSDGAVLQEIEATSVPNFGGLTPRFTSLFDSPGQLFAQFKDARAHLVTRRTRRAASRTAIRTISESSPLS